MNLRHTLLFAGIFVISAESVAADPPPVDVLLPPGAIRRFGDAWFGHPGGVSASVLSPDGKWLATAASQSVILWDAKTGQAIRRFAAVRANFHGGMSLAFAPDGTRLAAGGGLSGDLFVWDPARGKELHHSAGTKAQTDVVTFTPDGKELIVSRGKATEILDATNWKVVRTIPSASRLYSPVGPTLIGSTDIGGRVYLVDPLGKRAPTMLNVDTHPSGIALAPDGKTLAAFSVFGRLELWSIPDGEKLKAAEVNGDVTAAVMSFTPDGKYLFLSIPERTTCWDLSTFKVAQHFPKPLNGRVTGLHALPDGDTLLVCSSDGAVGRFSRKTGNRLAGEKQYISGVEGAATRDGRWLAVSDRTGRLDLWDTTTGKLVRTIYESGKPVSHLAFSPDGKILAFCRERGAELWDVATGRLVDSESDAILKREDDNRYQFSSGPGPTMKLLDVGAGDRVLLATSDRMRGDKLVVWSVSAKTVRTIARGSYAHGALTPDGKTAVVPIRNPGLAFFDTDTGTELRRIIWKRDKPNVSADRVTAMTLSPDGRRLAVATDDSHVHFCDPATGQDLAVFPPIKGRADVPPNRATRIEVGVGFRSLAFSSDGHWLLTAGPNREIRLWETVTRREVHRFAGHEGGVTFVGFGPSGRTILSTGLDGAAYQWDLRPPAAAGRLAWDDLADSDPAIAYRAGWVMTDDPKATLDLMRVKLPPVVGPTPAELTRLIADLNADRFALREAAVRTLTDLGPLATPALKQAAAGELSPEARERVTKILDRRVDDLSPAALRAVRAVAVLERIGTPDAIAQLKAWAAGANGAPLTEEARAAVARAGR
jgi:WD40 repeat protein